MRLLLVTLCLTHTGANEDADVGITPHITLLQDNVKTFSASTISQYSQNRANVIFLCNKKRTDFRKVIMFNENQTFYSNKHRNHNRFTEMDLSCASWRDDVCWWWDKCEERSSGYHQDGGVQSTCDSCFRTMCLVILVELRRSGEEYRYQKAASRRTGFSMGQSPGPETGIRTIPLSSLN